MTTVRMDEIVAYGAGRLSALAAALLLGVGLLLAPGEARAANECGAISSSAQSVTCSSTTYGTGIIYLNAQAGAANVATVIVPGGSTAWAVTAGGGSTPAGNAITLDSADNVAGGGLALTVGGASATNNQVAIARHASNMATGNAGNGIFINQQFTGASTVMVTVRSGVTIGTASARMRSHGIRANVWSGSGTAAFTNHGEIHSELAGIWIQRGSAADTTAATTITNTGAISAGVNGIYLRYLAGDATNDGNAKITNSGTITKHTGTGADAAIELWYDNGTGDAEVDNSGAITATAAGNGYGIRLRYDIATASGTATIKNRAPVASKQHTLYLNNAGTGASTIENSGALIAENTGHSGIRLLDRGPTTTATTGVTTVTNSGDITSTALGINVVVREKNTAGDDFGISITHSAGDIAVSASGGIKASIGDSDDTAENTGDAVIRVTGGSIDSRDTILEVANWQSGDSTITVSDGVTLTSSAQHGIFVNKASANVVGGITVTNAGTITTPKTGIYARRNAPTGAGNIQITNDGDIKKSGGDVSWDGILVEDLGRGDVTVTNSGDIGAADAMHERGIRVVKDAGSSMTGGRMGAITITTTGGAIFAKTHGIRVDDNADHTGDVTVTNGGDIGAERPIYIDRLGSGAVTVTNTGGNVVGSLDAGIFARNKAGDASTVSVSVSGGKVQSDGQSKPAIRAENRGTGNVIVRVTGGEIVSKHNAGIFAKLADAPANKIGIEQGGAISGRKGIYAQVAHSSTAETAAARAAGGQPVIDIVWTGTFAATDATAENDNDRFVVDGVGSIGNDVNGSLIGIDREVQSERTMRYGSPAGIEAQVMSWRDMARVVATGDDPGMLMDEAARLMVFDTASTVTALKASSDAIVAQFRAALESDDIVVDSAIITAIGSTAMTAADLTDAEISAYLSADTADARTLLQNVMAWGLSEQEKAVLQALATGDSAGLAAALTAMGVTDDDMDDDDYWSRVNALLNRYHTGNIRVAMNGGSIASRGDGIRAYYATPNDNNGAIEVTVAAGATVSGAMAGIYVANAGLDAGEAGTDDDILKQTVTVHGMVTGGTDAAVHLVGGGTLDLGATGVLVGGAGRPALLVNEPGRAAITIRGEVRGGAGAAAAMDLSGGGSVTVTETGRVNANDNGADAAIRVSDGSYEVAVYATGTALTQRTVNEAIARVRGGIARSGGTVTDRGGTEGRVTYAVVETAGDYTTGRYLPLALGADDGEPVTMGNDAYGGLPSGCPEGDRLEGTACVTPAPPPPAMPMEPEPQRPAAPMLPMDCDLTHGDCRLYEAMPSVLLAMNALPSYGERMASARSGNGGWARVETARGDWEADTSTQAGLAYDHDRSGVRAGIDMAVGDGRFGMAVHGLGGTADMAQSGGKIELTGLGVGVNGTAMAGDIYIDAQAAATWFDVDVTSATGTELKDGAKATGFALALEAGRPMAMGEGVTVTPRAGFAWSRVSLDDFADARAARRVSLEDASSLVGRLGVGVQTRTPGGIVVAASLDAMQEFSEETEVMFEGARLKASSETTAARVGLSATHSWDEDRYGLQASAGYTAGGGGNSELAGGLSLSVRF